MPRKKTNKCPICGKPIYSISRYCRKHAPFSEEHKKHISEGRKGIPPWNKNKKRPEHSKFLKEWWAKHPEQRERAKQRGLQLASDKAYLQKLSELLSGEKNPNWRGGLSRKEYKGFYQKLKDKIRRRDNFTCQLCGRTENQLGYRLSINHINFDKTDNREENLNALCKRCNSLINFNRNKWAKWFQEKIANMNGNGRLKENIDTVKNVD
jgi:5-methylcytosine-specific restriction endonuclease McrA